MNPSHTMQTSHHERGMALVAATIFLAIATLVLGALSLRAITQAQQVTQYVNYVETFEGTETAYTLVKANLDDGQIAGVGLGNWTPSMDSGAFVMPTWEEVDPVTMAGNPSVEYMAAIHSWGDDGIDNTGDGIVDGVLEQDCYVIHAFARQGGVTRQTESVMRGFDVNVWRNAIFGGAGQAGGLVNGNVRVHGSIHLLGENILPGNVAVAAMDLSGTSLVRNNYVGLSNDLRSRIPDPPTVLLDGNNVETLEAKLRVRNGRVGLSGNSQIGEDPALGGNIKRTMDGTYNSEGWTGNQVILDGGRNIPNDNVFSDNGFNDGYDLGTRVDLPLLDDDWRDFFTGETVFNPGTGANFTHEEFFNEVLLTGPAIEGNVTIRQNQNFYYNATRPTDPDPANRQPGDDYLFYDAGTTLLEMNGQITINGNLHMDRGSGNERTINYTGKAAILVYGDVTLDVNLLAQNADGTTAEAFPTNIFGIMASNDMTVGSNAQLTLMGAFYAQNTLRTLRQTTVIGSFVSSFFDLGTNVPSIFQVPSLPENLPLGMIGAYPIFIYEQVAWREIGVP